MQPYSYMLLMSEISEFLNFVIVCVSSLKRCLLCETRLIEHIQFISYRTQQIQYVRKRIIFPWVPFVQHRHDARYYFHPPWPSWTHHRWKQCVFYFFCLVLNGFVVPHLRICGVVKVTRRNHINSIPNQRELSGRTTASTEIEIRKLCFVNLFIYFCFRYEFFEHSIGPECGRDAYENGRAGATFREWSDFACGDGTDCSWRSKVSHIIVHQEKLSGISGRRNAWRLCKKIRGKRHHALQSHRNAACIFHWLCFSHFLHCRGDPATFSCSVIL